jgi:hypothetical protein
MFEVADHFSGRPELLATGFERGPRKPGHSASFADADAEAKAKAQAASNNDGIGLVMALLI